MTHQYSHPDSTLISFSDVRYILKKNSARILWISLILAIFGGGYALIRNPKYKATATFQEKENASSGISSSLTLIGLGDNKAGTPTALIASRKILEPVIKKLGLQTRLSPPRKSLIRNAYQNLKVEHALIRKNKNPVIPDFNSDLHCVNGYYSDEVPRSMQVKFINEIFFELIDQSGTTVANGQIGTPTHFPHGYFTIRNEGAESVKGKTCSISFIPMPLIADSIKDNLVIEPDPLCPSLINLEFYYYDRQKASLILNELLDSYKNHLTTQGLKVADLQLDYLTKRHEDTFQRLQQFMHKQSEDLQHSLAKSGFVESARELEFLARNQDEIKRRLLTIDLELERLKNVSEKGYVLYERYSNSGDPEIINQLLSRIRQLKQQRDTLSIALNKQSHKFTSNTEIESKTAHISSLTQVIENTNFIYQAVQEDLPLSTWGEKDIGAGNLLKDWYAHTLDNETTTPNLDNSPKKYFLSYLNNLNRLHHIQMQVLKDRIIHQQEENSEFQGINLSTANQLYLNYNKERDQIDHNLSQDDFILHQLVNPELELSTVCTLLNDPISKELSKRSSALVLELQDKSNRTEKEQNRLQGELELQRGFLATHLQGATQLLYHQRNLVDEKIRMIQVSTLDLINQEVSIIQKNLNDYLNQRRDDLINEKELLNQQMHHIRTQMAELPKRWVNEKLMNMEMALSQSIVEQVAKLVESKNLSHNLEVVESDIVDKSIAPIHPEAPRILFLTLVGAILGACISTCGYLYNTLTKGVPATLENLKLNHFHTSGILSRKCSDYNTEIPYDKDLSTIRKLLNHFEENIDENNKNSIVTCITSTAIDYSEILAKVTGKRGSQTLLIDFKQASKETSSVFSLERLNTQTDSCLPIIKDTEFDRLTINLENRYSIELLRHPNFLKTICNLNKSYPWIVLKVDVNATDCEVHNFTAISNNIAVAIHDETLPELQHYFSLEKGKLVSFMQIAT